MLEPKSDVEEARTIDFIRGFEKATALEADRVVRLQDEICELQQQLIIVKKWCYAAKMAISQVQAAADIDEW